MQLFSSPKPQFPPFLRPPPPNPNPNSFRDLTKIIPLLRFPLCSTKGSSHLPLQEQILCSDSDEDDDGGEESEVRAEETAAMEGEENDPQEFLAIRRPVKDASQESVGSLVETEGIEEGSDWSPSSKKIDLGLTEFAKKMPIFEPERAGLTPEEKPLAVNLELSLYRSKILARNFQFKESEKILRKCILFWPEDGRAYVALGKILVKQSKFDEARSVYERGCQASQGENPYIWQCWAVLENKVGNTRRARELFDAATVADKKHVAAWHGWAILEIKQGNIKKARNLLGKGLKYCGGNEYIYQTLALLEAKGNRFDQARYLFWQATQCNPKSCASWLAWAQVEMQQERYHVARLLFEKAIQASPKNRFAWHVWGIFEASQGDIEKGRKLLKIGHALNPRDPVLLQSLALLEYKQSAVDLARSLFKKASELDPRHQPVWIAWGWMEWKEGNISSARDLYRRALSLDSTSESAARCLQAWGVLEQRIGNLSAARRLFRSSLNINSQSYVTWMTWASLEEEQGNPVRAEEIRNLYFQQRTEVVDDSSWIMGFFDIIDPALDRVKRLLNLEKISDSKGQDMINMNAADSISPPSTNINVNGIQVKADITTSDFDLDAFVKDKLSLDVSKLDSPAVLFGERKKIKSRSMKTWRSNRRTTLLARP